MPRMRTRQMSRTLLSFLCEPEHRNVEFVLAWSPAHPTAHFNGPGTGRTKCYSRSEEVYGSVGRKRGNETGTPVRKRGIDPKNDQNVPQMTDGHTEIRASAGKKRRNLDCAESRAEMGSSRNENEPGLRTRTRNHRIDRRLASFAGRETGAAVAHTMGDKTSMTRWRPAFGRSRRPARKNRKARCR